ncbi:MAG: DUF2141 domain-containing protein [Pseudomonadota bacterium]
MKWMIGLVLAVVGAQATAAELTVTIVGIENSKGHIRLALYNDPENFRDEEKVFRSANQVAEAGSVTFTFNELDAGDYGIIVYHDDNDDGKMNRFLGMVPTEGYGLSTNPEVSGPPDFDDARFTLEEGGSAITINLNY